MEKQVKVSRLFDAAVEDVWKLWTEPEYVMQWWGPEKFVCPFARIEFREGGASLVSMQAPQAFGGQTHYSIWRYTKIVHHQSIEFVMNLADKNGNKQRPVEVGMPPDFPEDIRTVITFEIINAGTTKMTVTEYADFGQMSHFAQLGLEQSLDKAVTVFKQNRNQ